MASSRNISVSVFCRESGGEDCGLCLSLPTSHNCGWCSTVGVCTTLNQCKLDPFTTQNWLTGDVSHCSSPARISPQQSHNEDALLGLFIGLSVIACLIVSLILVILVILLKRTAAKNTGTKRSIATLQRKLFGRKNSQADEDPLPVVLLSYKADYDESLPAILQAPQRCQDAGNKRDSLYAIIDKKVSTPSSSFQGTMIFNHGIRDTSLNPLGKHRTIPQINRLSLLWNNSETSNSTILRGGEDNSYSPLPILIAGHESSESPPLPVSCQTSLMQMSTNQYYLVVQINVDEHEKSHSHVYENYP